VDTSASTLEFVAMENVWILRLTEAIVVDARKSARKGSSAFMGCAVMHEFTPLYIYSLQL